MPYRPPMVAGYPLLKAMAIPVALLVAACLATAFVAYTEIMREGAAPWTFWSGYWAGVAVAWSAFYCSYTWGEAKKALARERGRLAHLALLEQPWDLSRASDEEEKPD